MLDFSRAGSGGQGSCHTVSYGDGYGCNHCAPQSSFNAKKGLVIVICHLSSVISVPIFIPPSSSMSPTL